MREVSMKSLNFEIKPSISRALLVLLLALAAIPSCYAQSKVPPKTSAPASAAQSAPGKATACDLLTLADAESVIDLPLKLAPGGSSRTICTYLGSRPGMMAARRTEVRLER